MEIMSGVYQLKIPFPYNSNEYVNVYLLKDEEGSILLDTGWNTPETLSILDGKARESGCQLKDIRHIIITHAHSDHFGLASKLNELTGAELILHEAEAEVINFRWVNFDSFLRKVERYFYQHGVPTDELTDFLKVFSFQKQFILPLPKVVSTAKRLKGNEELCFGSFRFRVLLTPRYSPRHICLYEPEEGNFFYQETTFCLKASPSWLLSLA